MNGVDDTQAGGGPEAWIDALSDASLQRSSTAEIFRRGRTYAASGAVEVLAEQPAPHPALRAQVSGSDLYTTEVRIDDGELAGNCDCPNAMQGWFCKHQVAVALVWRDRLAGKPPVMDEAASKEVQVIAKRARTVKDRRQALHEFLHGQDSAALANKLLELADRDHDVDRELQQWRKVSEATDQPADLKPLITEVLSPGRDFISYRESFGFARRAEAVLPLLQQARARDANAALALCRHALHRAWGALEQADDSDGEIGGLCEAIGTEWLQSLQAAGSQPASFGDTYLQLRLDDPFGCFDADMAETAMGNEAMTRYRRVLAERWRQAKDVVLGLKAERAASLASRKHRAANYERSSESEMELLSLERLHLDQLEKTGDIEEALAVLRMDLSDPQDHCHLIGFLEAHGRLREAFTQAEQACKAFPDDWRLQDMLLRFYERDGWTEEALTLRRRQFDSSPSVERYHAVLKAGQAAGRDTTELRSALLEELALRETTTLGRLPPTSRYATSRSTPSADARDVSLRAEILCSERRWIEALALVRPPSLCSDTVMHKIAGHLPTDNREQALELLLRVFTNAMRRSSTPYRDELALVNEIAQHMDAVQRAAWLSKLRTEYKAKRNFVRDLPNP